MSRESLSLEECAEMFSHISDTIIESIDVLTEADRMGDADHGEGMARGFREVRTRIENAQKLDSVGEIVRLVGMALMSKVGGAAGAIFGTFFIKGATELGQRREFGSTELAQFLSDGLTAVKARGKAAVGDKTMVDALEPAAQCAAMYNEAPLAECATNVAEAARAGMESTKDMVAKTGKAKTLGESSKGHPDPGALSTYLILHSIAEFINR